MLIPLSSLQQHPSNSRRRNDVTSRMTKIVTYKRSLLITITILGIIHYYRSSPQYNNNNITGQSRHNTESKQSETSSYLYPPQEAHPYVFDYNPNDHDFRKSNSPKVIEFYDPKCGACQAFKYNYIEVAKKIVEQRPNVQFFGVSCAVYKSVCDEFDVKRFPKILAFPKSNDDGSINKDDGIEVPKGTGTIYFVAARLMKALRTKEEIEMDRVDSSKFAVGT
ncbi:hypothetical protein QTG54_010021 [Skeletonema marinoi]|uniref:Thioredoxin domain-containing protein n=1 Tax=Skeletonema marinoi TaxID=267567 RepID=A0AAD8Y4L9_9STRA|nr:hypothetical protein QTG54_010021 [Skeletonema marinoi]